MVWYAHLFQNFPQFIVIHTVKGFGIVNKADIDVFLKLSCFFNDPADVGNLVSGSSVFSNLICTSGSSQFTYCWSLAWRILSITLLAYEMNTVQGFSTVNEAEVDVFWNSFVFSIISQMFTIWSLVPLPLWNPVCTSESSRLTYCWSLAWRILSITLLACEMSTIVW